MKIILISDTHGYLDPKLDKYFAECDEIWHAGDLGSKEVVEKLEKTKKTRIVYGNIDDHEIRLMTKLNLEWEVEGVKFAMTHIAGKPGKYYKEGGSFFKKANANVYICGHSHTLLVQYDKYLDGLWLNPGACGNKGFHKIKTILRFDVLNGKVENMEVIELGPRSNKS
jgi:putative phosphoesterase